MSGRDEFWEEGAKRVLLAALGADRVEQRDGPGAPSATNDFDVYLEDRRIAVEVTRVTDPDLEQFGRALGSGVLRLPILERAWVLALDEGTHVRALEREVEGLLRDLERLGVDEVDRDLGAVTRERRGGDMVEGSEAAVRLTGLGVNRAACVATEPGVVRLLWPAVAAFEHPDAVVSPIEVRAADKVPKLHRADGDERHLFVWVDALAWPQHLSLRSGRVHEARPPRLQPGVDVVWAAAWVGTAPPRLPIWRASAGGAWRSVKVDPLVLEDLFIPVAEDT